ncbi:atrial natriuretic peptide-converting enzyme-like [Mercenaria mercenaria]|uniref:atrial natriuretic peptide-converting enzyme-like n=1 Tax=Mercenaria mercenaria TaxID=6596 RepID=UPI00234F7DF9|nr:atrial natriuretic peptide-converting enzyme-like [Mercenaria mercenaria]
MTSKNHEGLLDAIRYVDVETMQSPFQTFDVDGCITFWYYLNSTGHQPKSTTAQIYVYTQYEDTMDKQLLWFDHINRPFPTWSQGGIHVQGNRTVRLIVTAKTAIPYDAYTGVVSFDDVDFAPGACTVTPLDCDDEMFQCYEDNVCIPSSMVCDGGPDCLDASDEQHCDRPDGALQLVGGDGTYGKLAYFYSHAWRPVCYPTTDYEQMVFKLNTAHYACKELGFSGNSDAFSYRLWEKHSPTQIHLSCGEDGKCSARATIDECDVFAYIRCSNDVCFPGESLCPGTETTCVPESYFCDGQQDCPENMDEQCLCLDGEDTCIHTPDECTDRSCESCEDKRMFECQNHQCIPLQDRCDDIPDCSDGTDEYRCVQIEKNFEVTVFLNTTLTRETVCGEDVNLEVAEEFCRLAGQGYVTEITSGTEPIEKGVTANNFNEKMNCFPLNLKCQLPECGTNIIQDRLVQPFVINGRDASIEEWPWYGVLRMDGYFLCGVSLIHPSWALTVSHCIIGTEDSKYTVGFGTDTFEREGDWYQEITVVKIYEYGYIPSAYPAHDITLLRLEHPVLINNVTRPLCLPSVTSLDDVTSRGSSAECYVVGLGATEKIFSDPNTMDVIPDVLQKKRVHIVSYEYCKQIWLSETEGDGNFPTDIVCIATEGPSSPTCFGDSGSPLMCRADSGRWELIGAVSFGYGNCFHDLVPTVMTSVTKYNKWIKDTIEARR